MIDKFRFCARCKRVSLAEHFKQVARADGMRLTVCGHCVSDLHKAKTPGGQRQLQERDEAKRREEASAWNKAMSQFNGKGNP